jgi:hypothetical protein
VAQLAIRDDDDLIDLPPEIEGDDEQLGVEDAEELMLQDLGSEDEEVGLDTETLGSEAGLGIELDMTEGESLLDETPLEIEADIDAEGEEHGWTEETEGTDEPWDDMLPDDLDDGDDGDDGGEEGVEDPLLDGWPEDLPRGAIDDEDDDEEGFEDDDLEDFTREIGPDA